MESKEDRSKRIRLDFNDRYKESRIMGSDLSKQILSVKRWAISLVEKERNQAKIEVLEGLIEKYERTCGDESWGYILKIDEMIEQLKEVVE